MAKKKIHNTTKMMEIYLVNSSWQRRQVFRKSGLPLNPTDYSMWVLEGSVLPKYRNTKFQVVRVTNAHSLKARVKRVLSSKLKREEESFKRYKTKIEKKIKEVDSLQ